MLLANSDNIVLSDADNLRLRAVWQSHVEGLNQNNVAQRLTISRVMVVRLLAGAKRRNEVLLTISATLARLVELGGQSRPGLASTVSLCPSSMRRRLTRCG